MFCLLRGHGFEHEIQTIAQIFYPNESFSLTDRIPGEGAAVESAAEPDAPRAPSGGNRPGGRAVGRLYIDGVLKSEVSVECGVPRAERGRPSAGEYGASPRDNAEETAGTDVAGEYGAPPREPAADAIPCDTGASGVRSLRHALMTALFLACKEYTGLRTPWGSLTGIRPSKLVRLLLESGMDEAGVFAELSGRYYTEPEKIRLSLEVAKAERKILADQTPGAMSLYIGIPFCPSTCLYCSFASYPLEAGGPKKRLYWAEARRLYLEALFKELDYLSGFFTDHPLETVYIGGGTPTALDEAELAALLERVRRVFPKPREFSVEAGRPDSLNREKLRILKQYGADRISVNPQTMNDATLERIGRRHTVADVRWAFELAREEGHGFINADVILGLPGEDAADAERTMAELAKLAPESVTVHTLAVKRASRLRGTLGEHPAASAGEMEKMLLISREACAGMGMSPYYLYRQKNMIGNFENVGYCLPGREGLYNVYIMEETQTVWAAGAGAASKILYPNGLIKRVFNVKNLEDYINRVDEMIERKQKMLYFMG